MIGAGLPALDNLRRNRLIRTSTLRSELSPSRVRDSSISRSRAITRWALSHKATSRSNSSAVSSTGAPDRVTWRVDTSARIPLNSRRSALTAGCDLVLACFPDVVDAAIAAVQGRAAAAPERLAALRGALGATWEGLTDNPQRERFIARITALDAEEGKA